MYSSLDMYEIEGALDVRFFVLGVSSIVSLKVPAPTFEIHR
jgi:hypothetical protein